VSRRARMTTALFALFASTMLATGCVSNREGGPDVLTAEACRTVPLTVGDEAGVAVTGLYDIAVSEDAGMILLAGRSEKPSGAEALVVGAGGSPLNTAATEPPGGVYGIVVSDLVAWLRRREHPAAEAKIWPTPETESFSEAAAERADRAEVREPVEETGLRPMLETTQTVAVDRPSAEGEADIGAVTSETTTASDRTTTDSTTAERGTTDRTMSEPLRFDFLASRPTGGSSGVSPEPGARSSAQASAEKARKNRLGASAIRVEMAETLEVPENAGAAPASTKAMETPPFVVSNLSGDFAAEHPFHPVGLSVVLQPDVSEDPPRARAVGLMVANRAPTEIGRGSLEMFVFAPGGLIYESSLALPQSCPPLDVAALDPERAFVTVQRGVEGCDPGITDAGSLGPVGQSAVIYVERDQAQVVATGIDDARSISLEPLNFWANRRHLAVAGARSGTLRIYDLSELLTGTHMTDAVHQHRYTTHLPYTVRSVQWTPDGTLYGAGALETVELAALGTGIEIPTSLPNDRGRVWRLHAPHTNITNPSLIQRDEGGDYPDMDAVAVAGDLLLLGSATKPGLQVCTLKGTPPYDENLTGIQPDR